MNDLIKFGAFAPVDYVSTMILIQHASIILMTEAFDILTS